jgi:hypothetical protein
MTLSSDLTALRDQQVRAMQAAVAELIPSLQSGMDEALARIQASGYSPKVTRAEMLALAKRHSSATERAVLEQVSSAVSAADHYDSVLTNHVSKSALYRAGIEAGAQGARVSVARTIVSNSPAPPASTATAPQKLANANIKKVSENHPLSSRLHASAIQHEREIVQHAVHAVSEHRAMGDAGKRLIAQVENKGVDLGGGQNVPKLLQNLADKARGLAVEAGPAAQREMALAIQRAEKYTAGLAENSRTYTAWREAIDRIQKQGAKGVDEALNRWGVEKQRYNAERILQTETMAAYRSEQYLRDKEKPYVVGYIWRMNKGARKRFVKRVAPTRSFPMPGQPKKSGKHGRCICELLDGKRLGRDAPAEYPRGGHPHCCCWFEPVVDQRLVLDAPITANERAKWAGVFR